MDVEQVLTWISQNIIQIIVIGSIFIQITPIKWNPITSFVSWFGKIITKDVLGQIQVLERTVTDIKKQADENEKDRIRWEVLDFANSCRNGRRHTKDEFEHIVALNDKYHALLTRTNDKNGVFTAEYDYVHKLYLERLDKNDFL